MALVHHYKLDEKTVDTVIADSVGSLPGVLSTNTIDLSIIGKINNALAFNGSSGVLVTGAVNISSTVFSVSFWARGSAYDTGGPVAVMIEDGSRYGLSISLWRDDSGVLSIKIYYNTFEFVITSSLPALNKWTHFVFISNGLSSKSFYIDNQLIWTNLNTLAPISTITGVSIGQSYDTTGKITADIDDIRIYSDAISSDDINNLYDFDVAVIDSIIMSIVAQMQLITVAGGYNTNVICVKEDDGLMLSVSKLPCIEVKEISETNEIRGSMRYHELIVEITGWIATTQIDDARDFITDVVTAMKAGPIYPDEVYNSAPDSVPELLPEQKDIKAVKIVLSYKINFRTNII